MTNRDHLRHTIATLAYRGGKVLRDAPPGFGEFSIGETSRTPARILAHIGDLLDWGLSQARGAEAWRDSPPRDWQADTARFFDGLRSLDEYLASDAPLACSPEKLFQGAIADALTHIGQIAMLRRLADAPVRGENYSRADIIAGRVGPDQTRPRREFD